MIASLAAAVGLLGSFLALRADGGRLITLFAPAMAGMVVFLFCQGALGLFRSWTEVGPLPAPVPLERREIAVVPFIGPIGGDPWPTESVRPPAAAPALRVRRPAVPPVPPAKEDPVAKAGIIAACMIGSILLHSAVFFIALRVHSGAARAKEPERAGVFAASIVPSPKDPAPLFEDVKKEEPPPPPKPVPPPEPPKPAPPPPEPPKVDPAEFAVVT